MVKNKNWIERKKRVIFSDNESTPKDGHLDVSNAIHGPWLTVKDFTCLLSCKIN